MRRKRSHARLEEVARLLAQIPTYKELAAETGYCETYCRAVVSELVRKSKHTNVLFHVEHDKTHECVRNSCPEVATINP